MLCSRHTCGDGVESFNATLLLSQDSATTEEIVQLAAAAVSIAAAGATAAAAGTSQLPFQQGTWESCLPGQWHPLQLPVQCCPPLAAPPEQTSWGCPAYSSQSHDGDPSTSMVMQPLYGMTQSIRRLA